MADRYLLESGAPDGYLLEDGSGVLLLEGGATFLDWLVISPVPEFEEPALIGETALIEVPEAPPAEVDLAWHADTLPPVEEEDPAAADHLLPPLSDIRLLDWFVEFTAPQLPEEEVDRGDFEVPLSSIVPSDWLLDVLPPVAEEQALAALTSDLTLPPDMPIEGWLPIDVGPPASEPPASETLSADVLQGMAAPPVVVDLVPVDGPPPAADELAESYDWPQPLAFTIVVEPPQVLSYRVVAAGWYRPGAAATDERLM